MEREYIIRFEPGGVVTTLYNDDSPVRDILGGEISCPRASDVKWNEDLQCWEVCLLDNSGRVFTGFETRASAIAFEVDFLNKELENGPNTPKGP